MRGYHQLASGIRLGLDMHTKCRAADLIFHAKPDVENATDKSMESLHMPRSGCGGGLVQGSRLPLTLAVSYSVGFHPCDVIAIHAREATLLGMTEQSVQNGNFFHYFERSYRIRKRTAFPRLPINSKARRRLS
jgi:hypothetical protein